MIFLGSFELLGLGPAELIILAGVVTLVVRETADILGWAPSAKRLRVENEDLVRYNAELEDTIERHESRMASQDEQIAVLRAQVTELEKTNLAAVMESLDRHELGALRRHDENALRGEQQIAIGAETLKVLSDIQRDLKFRDDREQQER